MKKTTEYDLFRDIQNLKPDIDFTKLREVILIAIELAREGREGRKIGTMFLFGDSEAVLHRSKCLILDPLWRHPKRSKNIFNPDMRETIKELSQLDGAFVISNEGVALSACRYINATASKIELPMGLGSRHVAAASITLETDTIAVVVSESSVVRIFIDGEIVSEIIPELWLLRRHGFHVHGPTSTRSSEEVTVISKEE